MATVTFYYLATIMMVAMATADYKMLGIAPEGTQLLIECQPGNNMTTIVSATYGVANCSTKNVMEIVAPLCLGVPSCSIRVDDRMFGADNRCQGQKKNLTVEAMCSEKPSLASEPQPPAIAEYLSFGMVQRLASIDGLQLSENDVRAHFDACDHDHDDRISDSEIDELLRRLNRGNGEVKSDEPKHKSEKPKSDKGVITNSTLNNSPSDNTSAGRLHELIDTLSRLSDDIKTLLKGNKTVSPASNAGNTTPSPAPNGSITALSPARNGGNTTADNESQKRLAFQKMMSPPPTTAMILTSPPPMPKKQQGAPKNSSSVFTSRDVILTNGSGGGNDTDPFSTRTVVYIPTGQSRKLLCSGLITSVWFSTYWWPDSPVTEHISQEPECKHEEDVALEALKQM